MDRSLCAIAAVAAFLSACAPVPSSVEPEADLRARLEAQIRANPEAYTRRPTRRFVSGNSAGEFQTYVNRCLQKVLASANQNYPAEARGRFYGDVQVTFFVLKSGDLGKVEIVKTSGHVVLDQAILKAIRAASPFAGFSAVLPNAPDVLVITQTFGFERDGGVMLAMRPIHSPRAS